jgi:hypothetical protein
MVSDLEISCVLLSNPVLFNYRQFDVVLFIRGRRVNQTA